jgi:hypothetical protein
MSKKITDLTTKATAAAADWLLINDVAASADKKTTVAGAAAAIASSFADGAIPANALATSAIKLGYTQIISNFSTAATSATQVTGLTTTVTIPPGGRSVEIVVYCSGAYMT